MRGDTDLNTHGVTRYNRIPVCGKTRGGVTTAGRNNTMRENNYDKKQIRQKTHVRHGLEFTQTH